MQFSKSTDTAPNHLYVDIVIKMKSGKLYPPKLQTYMVCYGVKGLQTDVPSTVYDALWGIDNGKVTFNESIDMGNKKITGVADGTTNKDAVNKAQLDRVETQTIANKNDIATINLNHSYYYYTNDLKHNNEKNVKFPTISNSYPFSTQSGVGNEHRFIISLDGYYHVIYNDFYKGSGTFQITHDSPSGPVLHSIRLNIKSKFTPFTINSVFKIERQGNNTTKLVFHITNVLISNSVLDGIGSSSFYIKYLHP